MENVYVEIKNIDSIWKLYEQFYQSVDDSTGTIIIHHGKAKYPGKYVKHYSAIELFRKVSDADKILLEKGEEILNSYNLNYLMAVHNIGMIKKNDPILFLAVEAKDRVSGFNGIREMLEFIKAEEILGLREVE